MAKDEFALYAWTDEDDPNSLTGSYQEMDQPYLEKLKRRAKELIAGGKYKFVGIWGWDEADQCYQNEPIAEYP
jgi:hypothetical protein